MARRRSREIPPNSKTYGFPIYTAGWAPSPPHLSSTTSDEVAPTDGSSGGPLLVALGGGGGAGKTGVRNFVAVAAFDAASNSLADQPVSKIETEQELPYRMAVHPKGDSVICAFLDGCRLFEWESEEGMEPHNLALKPSEKTLTQLEDVGSQLTVSFNSEGSVIATGGEDGHLRVFKWPTMESILEEHVDNTSVKDLNFSSDERFLAMLRDSGPCRVWDLTSSKVVANLPREAGENFGYCRFSHYNDNNQVLFVTAMQGGDGKIISWNTTSWTRVSSKKITRDPISAFSISPNGSLLAIGTIEGNVLILGSSDIRVLTAVQKAHLGIVTALVFSHDSRALLSTSVDSFARVTLIETKKSNGLGIWSVLLVIILAILLYIIIQSNNDFGRIFKY